MYSSVLRHCFFFFFFFFSSRRRHTRCLSDWSSDVCSSDLPWSAWAVHAYTATGAFMAFLATREVFAGDFRMAFAWLFAALEIGRASCRERVEISVVAVS